MTEPKGKVKGKPKKEKDPHAPKGVQQAFFIFLGEKRGQLKAVNPDFTNPEIAQEAGRLWKELPEEAKEVYRLKSLADKERYEKEKENYHREQEKEN
jgi:hypothetical protein